MVLETAISKYFVHKTGLYTGGLSDESYGDEMASVLLSDDPNCHCYEARNNIASNELTPADLSHLSRHFCIA